jgi:hypothetical protein
LRYVHFKKIKHLLLEYLYMQRICKKWFYVHCTKRIKVC